ncbi:MAG: pyridoxamine 5'-phosphate oxidase family protein [Acidimicrobiales bacterium]
MGENQRSQITMTDEEIATFIERSRTATMATVGPTGAPHLVAMWYAVIDGQIWFETKAKAQKVKNLQRNGRLTVMIEDGPHLRSAPRGGVGGHRSRRRRPRSGVGDGVQVFERYTGPYTEEMKPFVEMMLNKRVAVRLDVERVRSWTTALGMAPMEIGGSTAAYLDGGT